MLDLDRRPVSLVGGGNRQRERTRKEETVAAQHYPIEVFGQSFTVTSEQSEEHVQMVAAYVDRKMRERARMSKMIMPLRVAIMAAIDIAEEVFKQHP